MQYFQLDIHLDTMRRTVDLFVPGRVEIRGEDLCYFEPWRESRADARILEALRQATDAASAAEFSRRYGSFLPLQRPQWVSPQREPLSVIMDAALQLPAVVEILRQAQTGGRILPALKRAAGCGERVQEVFRWSSDAQIHEVRRLPARSDGSSISWAAEALNVLLLAYRLAPQLVFDKENRRWALRAASNASGAASCALAAWLHFAVDEILKPADGVTFAECSICGRIFEPERKPAEGRRCYCLECRGSSEMWRLLKRSQRARPASASSGDAL